MRGQARDALATYLRLAIVVAALSALALGVLVALAARGGRGPRLRVTLAVAGAATLVIVALLVVLLPPRSNVDSPQYYANGPEVPAALRTLESLGASSQTLDDEIDEQLVGIARLVSAPANRGPIGPSLPRLTVASDLHNNVIALPALERAAAGGPLLFTGDLTDRGSALERTLVLRIVRAGRTLVFVSGNHDSDVLERKLAREGAIVLTRRGRLRADGSTGRPARRRRRGPEDRRLRRPAQAPGARAATPIAARRTASPSSSAFATWLQAFAGAPTSSWSTRPASRSSPSTRCAPTRRRGRC